MTRNSPSPLLVHAEAIGALERAETAYWSRLFPDSARGAPGSTPSYPRWIGSAFCCALPEVDILGFNRVTGLGLGQAVTDEQLNELIDHYARHRVPRFFLQLHPALLTGALQRLLAAKDFTFYNNWVKLCRPLDDDLPPLPATKLTISRVRREQASHFGQLIARSFEWDAAVGGLFAHSVGQPGYRHYFVREGGQVIAAGALFINGYYASLAVAATLPAHRGKGAQSLLLAHRIREARAAGCRLLISETAEERPERPVASYRNMRRYGLQPAYRRPNFLFRF